jgi:hypothetical protein
MTPGTANVNKWNRNYFLHTTSIHVGGANYWQGTVVQYIQRRRAAMWRASEGRPTQDDHKHWLSAPAVGKLTIAEQHGVSIVDREAYAAQMADRRLRR